MIINEVLSNSYKWNWIRKPSIYESHIQGKFTTNDGSTLILEITKGSNYLISFHKINKNAKGGTFSATGEGDQYRILATIFEMIIEFVTAVRPDHFQFISNKSEYDYDTKKEKQTGRSKLYMALSRKFASKYNYSFQVKEDESKSYFMFTRQRDMYDDLELN